MAEVLEPLVRDEANVGFHEIFEIRKVNNNPLRGNVVRRDQGLPGLISCTMPFTNGASFVAIGCSEGIWVADPHQPNFLHRVMDLKGVTEFAIIEAYSLLLILADKVLYCYALEALDPYNDFARVSHKLTSAVVDYFRVGVWSGRLAVVYKKKVMTDSVFHVLEPMLGPPLAGASEPIVIDFGPDRIYWFRFEKEFYVPADCMDIALLKSTVAVMHPTGFEILDIHTLSTLTIPNKDDLQQHSKALAKRCKSSTPLGLFRAHNGTILLCYTTFGLFVDRHGKPLLEPHTMIDWHGTVHAVVSAAPYIVLFKTRSIEVRRGVSGRLEQVLFGNGMRCAWRGPGMLQGELDEDNVTGARSRTLLQVVMNAPHGMGSVEVAQHVYDLVPASSQPL